jgi:predicted phage terminase large subunit-like protein
MSNSLVSPSEAAEELLARREARRRLEAFATYTFPGYRSEPAHGLIASTLDRVVAGALRRLMIFAPPQHGKSELVSVRLPAFWLGRHPDRPVLMASYAAEHAEFLSRQARDVVESAEFATLFPGVTTDPEARAVHFWRLGGFRGFLNACGVGGPVMGKGGLLGLVDDPFETWEQFQSLTVRSRVRDWFRGTFRPRIWEGGSLVVVMSRGHMDDLAGWLLTNFPGDWEVLRLPAVAESQAERDLSCKLLGLPQGQPDPLGREPGEALCPRRFSREALLELKRDVGPVVWPGQYQGVPHEPEGALFKRAWWRRFRDTGNAVVLLPEKDGVRLTERLVYKNQFLTFVMCDPSQSKKAVGDNAAMGAFALTPDNDLLVLDVVAERVPLDDLVPRLAGFCDHWRPEFVGIEDAFEQAEIVREARKHPGMPPVKALKTEGKDKLVRATPAVVRCSQGQMYLPLYAPWVDGYIEEHAQFTGQDDPHDDQVDITAYAAREQRARQGAGRQAYTPRLVGGVRRWTSRRPA